MAYAISKMGEEEFFCNRVEGRKRSDDFLEGVKWLAKELNIEIK